MGSAERNVIYNVRVNAQPAALQALRQELSSLKDALNQFGVDANAVMSGASAAAAGAGRSMAGVRTEINYLKGVLLELNQVAAQTTQTLFPPVIATQAENVVGAVGRVNQSIAQLGTASMNMRNQMVNAFQDAARAMSQVSQMALPPAGGAGWTGGVGVPALYYGNMNRGWNAPGLGSWGTPQSDVMEGIWREAIPSGTGTGPWGGTWGAWNPFAPGMAVSGNGPGMMSGAYASVMGSLFSGGVPKNIASGLMSAFAGGGMRGLGGAGSALLGASDIALPALTAYQVGSIYLGGYNSGEDYLKRIALMSRETGVPAQQASQLSSLMSLTMNPESPFATITFQQVAANLQNIADAEHGLITLQPQQQRFNNSLKDMGLSATDAQGRAKELIPFTIEVAGALERVNKLDPARYAQIIQGIGGIFGKDYAAIVGAGEQQVRTVLEGSVRINQQMLDLTTQRVVATQNAEMAEKAFEIAATRAAQPVDTLLQKLKQIALTGAAGALLGGQSGADLVAQIQKITPQAAATQNVLIGELLANMFPILRLAQMTSGIQNLNTPNAPITGTGVGGVLDQKAIDAMTKARDALDKAKQQQFDASLAENTKRFTNELGKIPPLITQVEQAQTAELRYNDLAISSFDSLITRVMGAAKAYDSYYESRKKVQDRIKEIEEKANQPVQYATYNGRPLQGSVKQVMDLAYDIRIAQAESRDEATNLQNDKDRLAASQAAEAIRMAPKTTYHAATRTRPAYTTTRPGPPESPTTRVSQAIQEQKIAAGGTSEKEKAIDEKQAADIEMRWAAMGGLPGEAITTENIKTAWGRAGMSKQTQDELAALYEQLKQLDLSDAENQFKTVQQGASDYMDALKQARAEGKISEEQYKNAADEMANGLDKIAKSAGLFQSVGFARSMAEAALQAELSSEKYGIGAAGIETYYQKSKDLYDMLGGLKEVLSGTANITMEQAEKYGIVTPAATTAAANLREQKRLAQYGEAEVSGKVTAAAGTEAANQQLRDRIAKGQVGPMEVLTLATKKMGLDLTKGIEGIKSITMDVNIDAATKKAKEVEDAYKQIFAKAYKLNIDASFNGLSPDEMRQFITDLKQGLQLGDITAPYSGTPIGPAPMPLITRGSPEFVGGYGTTTLGGEAAKGNISGIYGPPAPSITEKGAWAVGLPITFSWGDEAKANARDGFSKIVDSVNSWADFKKAEAKVEFPVTATTTLKTDYSTNILPPVQDYINKYGRIGIPTFLLPPTQQTPPGEKPPTIQEAPPRYAGGGPVRRGMKLIGGEKGAELFVPYADGEILNATMTERLIQAMTAFDRGPSASYVSSTSISNSLHIDARGAQSPTEVARAVERASQAIFLGDDYRLRERQERRRGGRT